MAKALDMVQDYIEESRMLGYKISGSVFKADYSGSGWKVGFWLRGVYGKDKSGNTNYDQFKLAPRMGKAKGPTFRSAVKKALERARECEAKYGPE